MTKPTKDTVGGEAVSDLVESLRGLKPGPPRDDGMMTMRGVVGPSAVRALMRIEAELLLADADAAGGAARTPNQRRADAFLLLGQRVSAALIAPSQPIG